MSKLALGTVQFGLDYGISNKTGRVNDDHIKKILLLAKKENIDVIDTAISYGSSEKAIGKAGITDFKFITKLPDIPKNCSNIDKWIEENVKSSITKLGIYYFEGILIHNSNNLLNEKRNELIKSLKKIKTIGLVKKIGISIYDPKEYERLIKIMRFDIVQAPLNIIDRRLVTSGLLSKLCSEGVEIHVRSIFLQGLLLMKRDSIPSYFDSWVNIWDRWELELTKNDLNPIELCLSYPRSLPEIDKIIVGVENAMQLNEIIQKSKIKINDFDTSFMISNDLKLINPYNWRKL